MNDTDVIDDSINADDNFEDITVPPIENLCANISASVKKNVFTLDNIELDNEDNIEYIIFNIDLDSEWDFYPSTYLCIQNGDKITWHLLTMGEVFINREIIGFPENMNIFIKGISEFVGEKQTNTQSLSLPSKKEIELEFVFTDMDDPFIADDASDSTKEDGSQ